MTNDCPHIVFSGGGTLGHLFPGLAVAEQLALAEPSARITFAGGGRECERRRVHARGFDYLPVACRAWPRRPWGAGQFIAGNVAGFLTARRFLRRRRVAAVVGLGGFVSAPLAKAAESLQLPLVLLEQNAFPGRVNRWLAPRAALVCAAFDSVRTWLPRRVNLLVTGTPVRSDFARCAAAKPARRRLLIVLGGSRGAESLNHVLPQFAGRIVEAGWRVVHQAGEAGAADTSKRYRSCGVAAEVVSFIDDMPGLLSRAGLVVCRAGGTTLAELAVTGTPAIVCPYPHAADDHQRRNALEFAALGACMVVDQRETNDARLGDVVSALIADADQRERMSRAMRRLAHPEAAGRIADLILEASVGNALRGVP
ncbi:MAG TPA: undecaprenyldiphospho-muramoylpentapeptide beta-N-acetylglucosaminyltransferase [Pirellulales bacterium]|nr:undecaprenyldiphospho-muramoylpentapeptide beta-N-acetylglucosaminyltransferase [Pirellulales bacterium]